MTTPNFDICFFGTPHGFEQVTVQGGFSLDLMRLLDFDTSRVEPSLGDNFFRVIERSYGGNFYRIVAFYTPAFEIDSLRPGGFCGVALIFQNSTVSDSLLIAKLLVELLNSLIALTTINGKFKCNIRDIYSQLKIPAELNNLKNSLITDRSDFSKVLSNSTLFVTAGKGLDFPSLLTCFNFINTTHIASRFIDICVIPEGAIAEKGSYKIKANSTNFLNSVVLISANESKTAYELNVATAKLNESNSKFYALSSELDITKSKLSLAEGKISSLVNSSPLTNLTFPSSTPNAPIPQPTRISPASSIKATVANQKFASSSEAIKKAKSFENEKNDDGYDLLNIIFYAFIIGSLCVSAFFITSYFMNWDFSNSKPTSAAPRTPAKAINNQTTVVETPTSSASQQLSDTGSLNNSASSAKNQIKPSCNLVENTKIDYSFQTQESTKYGFSEIAEIVTADLCPPLKGCEQNIKDDLIRLNPRLTNSKDLKNEIIKIQVDSTCDIRDTRFTQQKTTKKQK